MLQSAFAKDAIPSESAVLQLLSTHCQLMSGGSAVSALLLLAAEAMAVVGSRASQLAKPEHAAHKDRAVALLLPAIVSHLSLVALDYLPFRQKLSLDYL